MGASVVSAAQAEAQGWKLVVPWRPQQVTVDLPVLFAQKLSHTLSEPVEVAEHVYNQQDAALAWSLQSAKEHQPSLVLFSEELALVDDREQVSPRHLSHYEPLILIWQSRWCLFVKKDAALRQQGALKAWISTPASQPVVAIPEAKGRVSIWVQGMEQHTGRPWGVHVYGLRGSITQALDQGADIALSYCNRQSLHPDETHIVAQSGPVRSERLPDVPLFSELGLAPMTKGWMAWLAPKELTAEQRERMAQALFSVMGQSDVQAQLKATGHVVQQLTPQMTKQHIEGFSRTWRDIRSLVSMDGSQ